MNSTKSCKAFAQVRFARESVSIYRRKTPSGHENFMVANYSSGKRRFDSYQTEADARAAALKLAKQISKSQVVAASLTNVQAAEYVAAIEMLAPFGIPLPAAIAGLTEALKKAGNLSTISEAVAFYLSRRKQIIPKPIPEVVTELLAIKDARGASKIYQQDLRSRLTRFAKDCKKNVNSVTTADLQAWLDAQGFSTQGYSDFRNRLFQLFQFAITRGYATENPAESLERIKVKHGEIKIYTPTEIAELLAHCPVDFLPCLALGAFAGLRSAEVERLEWGDIDLVARQITVGLNKSKTASRRLVPICDALAAWLVPYKGRTGLVWTGRHDLFYDRQQEIAAAAGIKWKSNALRHSYISYRVSLTQNVNQVALEAGNSPGVIFKSYRELVKPEAAKTWFAVKPDASTNILTLSEAVEA